MTTSRSIVGNAHAGLIKEKEVINMEFDKVPEAMKNMRDSYLEHDILVNVIIREKEAEIISVERIVEQEPVQQ